MNEFDDSEFVSTSDDSVICVFHSPCLQPDPVVWDNLCAEINRTVDELSTQYLWHKDKFEVFLPILSQESSDRPTHLISSTCFGDNIEDEWFIVYIVFQISKKYQDLIIQIRDSDGDFLLIEAADYLPKWMNPESTDNRVFIYQNDIHIIPDSVVSLDSDLTTNDAVNIVMQRCQETKAAPEILQAIVKRIDGYPDKIKDCVHKAIVQIPADVAAVLTMNPKLISPLVNAYCSHDMIDEKCCRNITIQEMKTVQVTFTKYQYAMLAHSKPMKTIANALLHSKDNKSVLGLKLLCGYKIIMNETPSNMFNSKDYMKFLNSLKQNGYFKGNIEGSKDYASLLEKCNDFFAALYCPVSKNICNKITKLMSTDEYRTQLDKIKQSNAIATDEDSDSWLNIHPEQLNDLLKSRYGKDAKFSNDMTPQGITNQLSSFLQKSSDFEGIELSQRDNDESIIEFDPEMFTKELDKILEFISSGNVTDMDKEDCFSTSEESDDDTNMDRSEVDEEIKQTLSSDLLHQNTSEKQKFTYDNIIKGLQEEGFSGPSSNLLKGLSMAQQDVLDSDDDPE